MSNMTAARPVWPHGREREMNLLVGFRAVIELAEPAPVVLRVAASSLYRAFLDGEFVGHGPARAAHGFHRIDEWPLELRPGTHVVAIEVAGYNCNSYYLPDQPAFLRTEVTCDGRVLAATGAAGAGGFEATVLDWKLQRVHRYSMQRTFSEVYRLVPEWDAWRRDPEAPFAAVECAVLAEEPLLPRGVPYPDFALRSPLARIASGRIERGGEPGEYRRERFVADIGPTRKGFTEDEVDAAPMLELRKTQVVSSERADGPPGPLRLGPDAFHVLDFGTNRTGFLAARVTCRRPTRLFFTFDEILTDGDVALARNHSLNLVAFDLAPGAYDLETFEPYTLRYLRLTTFDGECTVEGVRLRELANPDASRARFHASDDRLDRVFEAGRETFRQNAVDLFMDCPSRERAGWLCDSVFTARAAFDLCGDTRVERNFLENFLLPDRFEPLPDGMLPMCYPADHPNGTFIPNWAMWFVVQLEEYLARSGDRRLVDAFRPKVLALFDYFRRFENDDGLLEKLESWVFIEWSRANDFVQDVNYPSNALYAGALDAAARTYGLGELAAKADRVRRAIREQAFDGAFFADNAVRRDGRLARARNTSETCQYYLFYFDVATPETHPDLWRRLVEEFGPARDPKNTFPNVPPSNAFIGNVLRLELLSRHGLCRQAVEECIGYYLYMAEKTGTLWEKIDDAESCNHGFASHVCHLLRRDALGIRRIDPVRRAVVLRFCDGPLDWCEGSVPTGAGAVSLRWRREGWALCYDLRVPPGYTVEVENPDGLELRPFTSG